MKTLLRLPWIAVILITFITACTDEDTNDNDVGGKYVGVLTGSQLKSTTQNGESKSATAEIIITGKNEILVHCYTDNFDTIFLLNYYHHNDSAYVCLTGEHFQRMYGHELGEGHHGHMMDDIRNGESEWMHHMREEHQKGDHHFGGFNMQNHHFSYTFLMHEGDDKDDMHFQGVKD